MNSKIEHEGVILAIYPNKIIVRIEQLSACADCHAKQVCSISDKKEKLIEIPGQEENFSINEKVLIEGESSMGLSAVWYAFVLPLVLMFFVLFLVKSTLNEVQMVWVSLSVLTLYYAILFLFRHKMQKRFVFHLKKKIEEK